jgi:hypothetical protein
LLLLLLLEEHLLILSRHRDVCNRRRAGQGRNRSDGIIVAVRGGGLHSVVRLWLLLGVVEMMVLRLGMMVGR